MAQIRPARELVGATVDDGRQLASDVDGVGIILEALEAAQIERSGLDSVAVAVRIVGVGGHGGGVAAVYGRRGWVQTQGLLQCAREGVGTIGIHEKRSEIQSIGAREPPAPALDDARV